MMSVDIGYWLEEDKEVEVLNSFTGKYESGFNLYNCDPLNTISKSKHHKCRGGGKQSC